jgi:hypothetical protein
MSCKQTQLPQHLLQLLAALLGGFLQRLLLVPLHLHLRLLLLLVVAWFGCCSVPLGRSGHLLQGSQEHFLLLLLLWLRAGLEVLHCQAACRNPPGMHAAVPRSAGARVH